jgi:hypothetical protein
MDLARADREAIGYRRPRTLPPDARSRDPAGLGLVPIPLRGDAAWAIARLRIVHMSPRQVAASASRRSHEHAKAGPEDLVIRIEAVNRRCA